MLEFLPLVVVVALENLSDFSLMWVSETQGELHGFGDVLVVLRVGSEEEIEGGMLEIVVDDLCNWSIEANGLALRRAGMLIYNVQLLDLLLLLPRKYELSTAR